jgi:hypothetical protein
VELKKKTKTKTKTKEKINEKLNFFFVGRIETPWIIKQSSYMN